VKNPAFIENLAMCLPKVFLFKEKWCMIAENEKRKDGFQWKDTGIGRETISE